MLVGVAVMGKVCLKGGKASHRDICDFWVIYHFRYTTQQQCFSSGFLPVSLWDTDENLTSSSYSEKIIVSVSLQLAAHFLGIVKAFTVICTFLFWELAIEQAVWVILEPFLSSVKQMWRKQEKKITKPPVYTYWNLLLLSKPCCESDLYYSHYLHYCGWNKRLKCSVSFSSIAFYFSWIFCAAKSNRWYWFHCIVSIAHKFREE